MSQNFHSLLYFIHNRNNDFCALQSEMESKQYRYKKSYEWNEYRQYMSLCIQHSTT